MGKSFSKEEVIVNQNGQQEVASKLNLVAILMLAIIVAILLTALYWAGRQCQNGLNGWLRRELRGASTSPPAPDVVFRQPSPQQPAMPTASAGYA